MTAALTRPAHRLPAAQVLGADVVEASNVDEALTIANLNWGLVTHAAENMTLMAEDDLISTSIPGQRLIMRDDTYLTLAAVRQRYEAVDNRSAFSLADDAHALGATFAGNSTSP